MASTPTAGASMSLTEDPIPTLTRRIAIPASIGLFFNTMFNFVDTYCAGLLGTDALAALSISFPVFFLMIAVGSGLSQGTTALLAGALGARRPEEARHVFAQALLSVGVLGGLLTLGGWWAAPHLFRLLGAEGDYLRIALAYMNVILGGSVFFLLQMTLNTALNAEGETRVYRNFLIAGFVANCVLNPIFMWGWLGLPAMGVGGIAAATLVVQIGGGILLWRAVRVRTVGQELRPHLFRPDFAILRTIATQAVPAGLNMLTVGIGVFVITWFVKHFGKEAVAAIGIATRIEQIVLMPAIGISTAVLSLVGQNHGAGLPHRVRETWVTNVLYGAGLMLLGGVIVYCTRHAAMRQLTDDPAVIRHGADYLVIAALTLPAYPILFTTVFLMQGIKRPMYGLWMGIYRQVGAPLVVFHTLAFGLGWGLWGVWWGILAVTWSATLFALWWGWRVVRYPE